MKLKNVYFHNTFSRKKNRSIFIGETICKKSGLLYKYSLTNIINGEKKRKFFTGGNSNIGTDLIKISEQLFYTIIL